MSETTRIIKEVTIQDYTQRRATIIYVDNKFDRCSFSLNSSQYDYDDWMFLKAVAKRIEYEKRLKLVVVEKPAII